MTRKPRCHPGPQSRTGHPVIPTTLVGGPSRLRARFLYLEDATYMKLAAALLAAFIFVTWVRSHRNLLQLHTLEESVLPFVDQLVHDDALYTSTAGADYLTLAEMDGAQAAEEDAAGRRRPADAAGGAFGEGEEEPAAGGGGDLTPEQELNRRHGRAAGGTVVFPAHSGTGSCPAGDAPYKEAAAAVVVATSAGAGALRRALGSLLLQMREDEAAGGAFHVYVAQDGARAEVREVAMAFAGEGRGVLRVMQHAPATSDEPDSHMGGAFVRYLLHVVFRCLFYERMVLLDDSLQLAPDFLSLMLGSYWLLHSDPSVMCVSGWNDVGQHQAAIDPLVLWRSDSHPGRAFMVAREEGIALFKQGFPPSGPEGEWRRYLNLPSVRRGRQCVCPEVPRAVVEMQEAVRKRQEAASMQAMALNEEYVPWEDVDISVLLHRDYLPSMLSQLMAAPALTLGTALERQTGACRVPYASEAAYVEAARALQISYAREGGLRYCFDPLPEAREERYEGAPPLPRHFEPGREQQSWAAAAQAAGAAVDPAAAQAAAGAGAAGAAIAAQAAAAAAGTADASAAAAGEQQATGAAGEQQQHTAAASGAVQQGVAAAAGAPQHRRRLLTAPATAGSALASPQVCLTYMPLQAFNGIVLARNQYGARVFLVPAEYDPLLAQLLDGFQKMQPAVATAAVDAASAEAGGATMTGAAGGAAGALSQGTAANAAAVRRKGVR